MKKLYFTSLIVLLFAAVSGAQVKDSYELTLTPYQFKSSKGAEVSAELGKFFVPENRKKEGTRKIPLSFVRFKSTGTKPGSPIVYLAGGPGGSGIASARGARFDLFMALREFGDVIAFDQRGTGMSNSIPACEPPNRYALEKPGVRDEMIGIVRSNLRYCMTTWIEKGMDVTAYNNNESADDIEDLRKALGAEKVTLWGISYGTQLAFSFLKRHESSVDRLLMAALEATGDNIKQPAYVDHFLETAENEVLKNPSFSKFPPLRKLMKDVLDKLDREPVVAAIKDRSGNEVKIGISKLDVQLVTSFFLVKNPSDLKNLPGVYYLMANGNFQEMAKMVYGLKAYASSKDFYGMGLLMDAMTGVTPAKMKVIEEQGKQAILGRTTNFPFPDLSEGLGLPDLGEAYRDDVKSTVPGLFLSGTLDGRTFMEDAVRIAGKFRNVKHVVLENAGHDMFEQSPKVQELIVKYFRGEQIPRTISLEPVEFMTK